MGISLSLFIPRAKRSALLIAIGFARARPRQESASNRDARTALRMYLAQLQHGAGGYNTTGHNGV